jgi:ketosteroid isomerase-like protein
MTPENQQHYAADVMAVESRFFDALVHGDLDALGDVLAEDFLIVEVMAGSVVSRADFMRFLAARQVTFESVTSFPEEAVVRGYGPTAVVVGRTEQRLRLADDQIVQVASRYTHLYASDGNQRWRLASAQGTPISEAPPA